MRNAPLLVIIFLFTTLANTQAQKNGKRPFECGKVFYSPEEIKVDAKVKSYLQYATIKAGDVIADVGAENGYFSILLSMFYDSLDFYLQDINSRCLNPMEFGQVHNYYSVMHGQKIPNTFTLVRGEQNETHLPKGIFDAIIMNDVIHQLQHPVQFFKNLLDCLKEDGILYIGQYDQNGLSTEAIKLLASKGGFAFVELKKADNYNLFIFNKYKDFCPFLENIHQAAIMGDLDALKFFVIDRKIPVDEKDEIGFTPLMYASKYGHLKMVTFLVNAGANVNARGNKYEIGPLQLAVKNNYDSLAILLIERGADVNASFKGESVLMSAAQNGNIDLMNFLLNKKADKRYKNEGKGIGFYAVESDRIAMIKYAKETGLLKAGMKDLHKRNLLFYAANGDCLECTKYLIESVKCDYTEKDIWGCNLNCYVWNDEIINYLSSLKAQ